MIQSAEATALALAVTREAQSHRASAGYHRPEDALIATVRKMVARYRRDGYRGRIDDWQALCHAIDAIDRRVA